MIGWRVFGTYLLLLYSVADLSLGNSNGYGRSLYGLLCWIDECGAVTDPWEHSNCYLQKCASRHDKGRDAVAACVEQRCPFQDNLVTLACGVLKCIGKDVPENLPFVENSAGTGEDEKRFEVNRRYNDAFFWPDEMETRSVHEHLKKRDIEHNDGVKSTGCAMDCHGFSGKNYDQCVSQMCGNLAAKNAASPPVKRWSTRLCMEAHCKDANGKVQYFLCGKEHCHR